MSNFIKIFFRVFGRKPKTPFMPLYDTITESMKTGKILTLDGEKFRKNTYYNYKTAAFRLRLWEKHNGTIYLEDINVRWAERFSVFLMQQGYSKNSIGATFARMKAVLRRLYNNGVSKHNGYGIRASQELVTAVYNTIDELRDLLNFDFTDTPGLERVRDVYILQCFVGLRYSDLRTFLRNPKRYIKRIDARDYIEIKTTKTGEVVVIPVSNVVKDILNKYNYNFGNLFSYQYFNLSIKEMAKRAGFTQEIVFTRTEGGERVDRLIPKWQLMSSHTARRTFATNAFLAGVPVKNIMLITGHKTVTSFDKYIRCSNLDAAVKIGTHEFFSIEMPITIVLPEIVEVGRIENP